MYQDGRLKAEGAYHKVVLLVDEYIDIHRGEPFDLDRICKELKIIERENRKYVAIELSRKVSQGKLEKVSNSHTTLYRYIDNTYKLVNWVDASPLTSLDITFPYGIEDNTHFGFDGHVTISPGDIIIVAGVSNMGKTVFALNFLWENMDKYPCFLMGNEYFPAKFKRRISRMTWHNPLKEDGTPKFELAERHDNWKDIIKPNYINIVDWINLDDNFYKIGSVIEGIQSKLVDGIALLLLQKSEGKGLGLGGGFSEHLASLYLTIDFNRLTVRKLKEWKDINTNGKVFGFEINNGGANFHNIRPLIKCPECHGYGKVKGIDCDNCNGSGWADTSVY